ncbi:undecaprenyl-diphosphate phosphatase [Terribacillus saccharophilus]|uniref:undecaprenyl-diphosphate phosphatase n=1 Tax=Terribacillus saccharophilus TaxID=361277 RepID=UPI0039820F7C
MYEIIVGLIMGLVEGLTEFAPVSSTGHMIIVDDLWLNIDQLFNKEVAITFMVVIQLGSILAAVIVFKDRFMDILGIRKLQGKSDQLPGKQGKFNLGIVITGLIPAAVLGFLVQDLVDKYLFSISTVIAALIVGAILMIVADRHTKKHPPTIESLDALTYKKAFLIGLFQCIALWPGFSRSGSTISGGVLLGLNHRVASDFTFIMAVPVMAGASALTLIKHLDAFTPNVIPFFVAGFISAFIFALLAIRTFLKIISKYKLLPFAVYRIILAAALLIVLIAAN